MENNLTFDQLPNAISNLTNKVDDIARFLKQQAETPAENPNELLNVKDAAHFLSLAVPTVYSLVSRGELPFMKKTKRIYFSRLELLAYIKGGRKSTNLEQQAEADQYLVNRKGKKGV